MQNPLPFDVHPALATGLALAVLFFTLTSLGLNLLHSSRRETLALWLLGAENADRSQTWQSTFCTLFDVVFGARHLSGVCILASSLASIGAVLSLYYLLDVASGLVSVRAGTNLPLAEVLILGTLINLVPDWLSLGQTRWVLNRFKMILPLRWQFLVLLGDFLLTGTIIWAAIKLVLWARGEAQIGLVEMAAGYSAYTVFFWSTFLTSLWAWMYAFVALAIRIVARLKLGSVLDIEHQPGTLLAAVGAGMMVPVGAVLWWAAAAGGPALDRTICTFTPAHCPYAIRAQQKTAAAFSLLETYCGGEPDRACLQRVYPLLGWTEREGHALFVQGCDGGSATACFYAGANHHIGIGTPIDVNSAADLFERACDGDHMTGCYNLGVLFENGRGRETDVAIAVDLYQRACDGGVVLGCYNLAFLLESRHGRDRDETAVADLFQRACDGGVMHGCVYLGFLFENGRGRVSSDVAAADLYQRACDGGNMRGCTNLGFLLENGRGRAINDLAAASLYQRACDGGEMLGCFYLSFLFVTGRGVPRNLGRAVDLLSIACDGGDEPACEILFVLEN